MKKKRDDIRNDFLSREELVEARKNIFHLTSEMVGNRIGVARQTINNIENGKTDLTNPIGVCIMLYFKQLIAQSDKYHNEYMLSKYHQDIISKIESFEF